MNVDTAAVNTSRRSPVQPVFVAAIFLSAFLLFLIEPMFAKMVLPLYGGSSAVWNTAVVFYQTALVFGYGYAHLSTMWLGSRRQSVLHLVLLLLPAIVLPITVTPGQRPPTSGSPAISLLLLMLATVGLPFIILSASSPVLQRWFAGTDQPAAADPYRLYAASNVGSMVGLLSYPLLIEPGVGLRAQSWFWTVGYGLLVVLMLASAVLLWRSGNRRQESGTPAADATGTQDSGPVGGPVTLRRRLRWILLAFVPASLMLSVTSFLSTDLPSFPLLWVLPLALYLLSFILVFSQVRSRFIRPAVKAMPAMVLALVLTLVIPTKLPIWVLVPLHLTAFLVIAVACHGVMAEDRPAPSRLTEFYFWMALGGALGGAFNALLAPVLFREVLEYPLGLLLAVLFVNLQFGARLSRQGRWVHVLVPIILGVFGAGVALWVLSLPAKANALMYGVVLSVPAVLVFSLSRRRGLAAARLAVVSAGVHDLFVERRCVVHRAQFLRHQPREARFRSRLSHAGSRKHPPRDGRHGSVPSMRSSLLFLSNRPDWAGIRCAEQMTPRRSASRWWAWGPDRLLLTTNLGSSGHSTKSTQRWSGSPVIRATLPF